MHLLRAAAMGLIMVAVSTAPGTARAQEQTPASLWGDFNHYVRVARPDLAQAAAEALMSKANPQQLLDIVEASEYKDYDQTLQRASRIESLRDTAQQIADQIQAAKIKRSREPQRILDDIQNLAKGKRANFNATQRLKAGGQYAAPYLLAALLDEDQQKLHAVVLGAMVEIGLPMVYPLSVAVPHLEPVPLGQTAQVLAEIGYPQALPYLKQVLETSRANPLTLSIIQSAFDRLAEDANISVHTSAAELFLSLGLRQYTAGTKGTEAPGYDADTQQGLVWEYDREAGLVAIPVPSEIYADALAMRSAQHALRLSPQMDESLSLWLMANLRRENRLPQGVKDRSYPAAMHPPSFYIEMAGPLRQHDVLDRALEDNDIALALDAVAALASTAGTEALINREGTIQPLLRALTYPDRRVRFNAAFAMTNARPRFTFPGSDLVVPVLAEAVRQSASRHAVVLTPQPDTLNSLMATVRDLQYEPIGGLTLDEVAGQINASPSVDLIVIEASAGRVAEIFRQTLSDYRLASVPIVAVVKPIDKIELARRLGENSRLFTTLHPENPGNAATDSFRDVFERAHRANFGATINPQESKTFASTALGLLRQIAASNSTVYNVSDALPTLIQALGDDRQEIATQAARVLAVIDEPAAQSAIADAAMDATRPLNPRVALLESLAESARFYGNDLSDAQLAKLLELVKTSRGGLVNAGAQAYGALTLPTSDVVQLIAR